MGVRPTMVGRAAELAALRGSLEEARSGRRRLVLVSGEPGIGKSRLLDEFAAEAAENGADVAWGRCWEAGGAPAYWPWPEVLRETLRRRDRVEPETVGRGVAALSQLLPELGTGLADEDVRYIADPDAARFRLFEAVAEFLRAAAEDRPLVLLLDDLHAADESSLLLLQFLAAESSLARLLLVVAYRDVELVASRPLTAVARDLARIPATTHLTLTGFTRDEVAELTELTTSVAPSPLLAARLRDQTDGNPLYVGEVARLLAAEGRLGSESAFERLTMPRDVRETVLRRLERLSAETTQLMAAASVFGRDFRVDALSAVAGGEAVVALAEAEAANLVSTVPDHPAHLRFSHAVIAEALYDELPMATRLDLHSRSAETLERLYADDVENHLAELARHFSAAVPVGDRHKAIDYSLRAGDRAMELLAYEEGIRLYRLALGTMEGTGTGEPPTRLRALLALGDALARAGDSAAAKETFLRAAELARRTGDGRDLALAALGYGGRLVWFRAGTDTRIVPLLREALGSVPEDQRSLKARLLARLSGALRDEPSLDERDRSSAEAVALARQIGDPSVLAYALAARFSAIWGPDRLEEMRAIAPELERLALETEDAERLSDADFLQFVLAVTVGRIDEMRRCFQRSAETAERLRQPAQGWFAALVESVMLMLAGDLGGTEALVERTRLAGQRAQSWDVESSWLLVLPLVRWEQGRLSELAEDLVRGQIKYPGYAIFRCYLALLHAEAGRHDSAAALVDDIVAGGPAALPKDNGWLAGMTVLSEAVVLLQDDRVALVLYDLLHPYRDLVGAGGGEAVTGSVHRPLGQLATLLGRYEAAEEHFQQALEIHARMDAPVWTCHTEYDFARMLLRRGADGDVEQAHLLLRRSRERAATFELALIDARTRGAPDEPDTPAEPDATGNVFRRDGEYWAVAFEGHDVRLRHSKGLEYLAALLANPHVDIPAVDLVAKPGGAPAPRHATNGTGEGDTGLVLDDRARSEYRARLRELQEELDEAEQFGDQERATRAKVEIDFLATELAAAVGLGGRPRRAGSPAERARQSVRKAISAALDRIASHDPALGRHLGATVRTGYVCRYEPDPRSAVDWRT